jgi:hypothetical protein
MPSAIGQFASIPGVNASVAAKALPETALIGAKREEEAIIAASSPSNH